MVEHLQNSNQSVEDHFRPRPTWIRLCVGLSLLVAFGAAAYDFFPHLTLDHRIDTFMNIAQIGKPQGAVEAELEAAGFEVQTLLYQGKIYNIRTREPILARIGDAVALSFDYDKWWASKKRPHHASVTYDSSNCIQTVEFGSQFNPLW